MPSLEGRAARSCWEWASGDVQTSVVRLQDSDIDSLQITLSVVLEVGLSAAFDTLLGENQKSWLLDHMGHYIIEAWYEDNVVLRYQLSEVICNNTLLLSVDIS